MGPRVQHCTRQALRCLCGLVLSINTGLAVCPPGHHDYDDDDGDGSNDNEDLYG